MATPRLDATPLVGVLLVLLAVYVAAATPSFGQVTIDVPRRFDEHWCGGGALGECDADLGNPLLCGTDCSSWGDPPVAYVRFAPTDSWASVVERVDALKARTPAVHVAFDLAEP